MTSQLMSFDEYANGSQGIFKYLQNIRDFTIIARLPRLPIFDSDALAYSILYDMYDRVAEVVRAAEVYHENEIEIAKEPGRLIVRYNDDAYEFAVVCDQEYVLINRSGSALSNFHHWYVKMMPFVYGLIGTVASILDDHLKRQVVLNNASFRFRFLLYGLRQEETGAKVKNSQIMLRLLRALPDNSGALTRTPEATEEALASMGRADALMTRWTGGPGRRRLFRYSVEAPANQLWSTLWCSFDYGGETYTSPETGERERFDASAFLAEYDQAYVTFLRNAAINHFMSDIMTGYAFETTASSLPW